MGEGAVKSSTMSSTALHMDCTTAALSELTASCTKPPTSCMTLCVDLVTANGPALVPLMSAALPILSSQGSPMLTQQHASKGSAKDGCATRGCATNRVCPIYWHATRGCLKNRHATETCPKDRHATNCNQPLSYTQTCNQALSYSQACNHKLSYT